jgi:hypothetical protein
VIGFATIYTDEPLPTGGPAFCYDQNGTIVLVVHEPSLIDDPRGVLDAISCHCDANTRGHLRQLEIAV